MIVVNLDLGGDDLGPHLSRKGMSVVHTYSDVSFTGKEVEGRCSLISGWDAHAIRMRERY